MAARAVQGVGGAVVIGCGAVAHHGESERTEPGERGPWASTVFIAPVAAAIGVLLGKGAHRRVELALIFSGQHPCGRGHLPGLARRLLPWAARACTGSGWMWPAPSPSPRR